MGMSDSKKPFLELKSTVFVFIVLSVLMIWWIIVNLFSASEIQKLTWAASYQIVAIVGGLFGLFICQAWGSFRSVMGRSILAFSLGLLFQVFGQSAFSFYNLVLQIEIPYPSIADVGFFGSIPFYIYGIMLIAKASGLSVTLKSFRNKAQAVLIPLIMVIISYLLFLKNYEFDWSEPLKVFLDFGYPMGQAIYISIALLTFLLSKNVLGGIMRPRILFLLLALLIQYVADFNFLYQVIQETWENGSYGDLLYLIAYASLTLGLLMCTPKLVKSKV